MRRFYFVGTLLLQLAASQSGAQDFSNKGKEFWLCFPSHVPSSGLANMVLFLTSDKNSSGTVSVNGFTTSFTVTANQISGPVSIPYNNAYVSDGESGSVVNKGIHVVVNTGQPAVVVYAHIYAGFRSEASLILPVAALGKKYYSTNFWQASTGGSKSQFQVVATKPNTVVQYQLRRDGVLSPVVQSVTLVNAGDVFQVQDEADLTGSAIESIATATSSCNKIAVFSGSSALSINSNSCTGNSFDPLFQQCYSVNTWGKNFGIVPLKNNPRGFHVRVTAAEDNTTVNFDGTSITLNAGEFFPATAPNLTPFTKPMVISADKPISTAQYLMSADCTGSTKDPSDQQNQGDPDMIILNPVEQSIGDINIFSSDLQAIRTKYLCVYIKSTLAPSFRINNAVPSSSFEEMPQKNGYSYLVEELSKYPTQSFRLTADSGFNAFTYGMGGAESYGYSAGTNVKDLYQYISVDNTYATVDVPATCKGAPFKLAITFPYQPSRISWQFHGLFPDRVMNSPAFTQTKIVDGKTLYQYNLPTLYNIATTGEYPVTILAENPTADDCNGEQELEFDLQVYDPPVAGFNFSSDGCISNPVNFSDNSVNSSGRAILHRYWSFGDGGTATELASTSHTYAAAGNYIIKYMLISDVGCKSVDSARQVINMTPPPVAVFDVADPACAGMALLFKEKSPLVPGLTLAKWHWNFGDNSAPVTATSNAGQSHVYAIPGNYNVSLQEESDKGCLSAATTKAVEINPVPVAAFIPPVACVNDLAPFIDGSSISPGTIAGWDWSFGDAHAAAGNPNTAVGQQLTHHYTFPGDYTAQLIVTSDKGCKDTVQRNLSINGAVLTPAFSVEHAGTLCSDLPLLIKDASTVDAGKIVRVDIFWDANDLSIRTTDDAPEPGKSYSHSYPGFASPASRTYRIRYDVYSGIGCVNSSTQTVTLLAVPDLTFDALLPVCSNVPGFVVDNVHLLNGLEGAGTFNGEGISASGFFDPAIAGAGSHVLTYTYAASNGCTGTTSQTIRVDPTPLADAGPDKAALEGGQVMLTPGIVSGYPVSYSWTPDIWLSDASVANTIASPLGDTTYRLTVTSDKGCTTADLVFVKMLETPVIPNIFSPNGDGIHDRWVIDYLESYPGCVVQIYNRYGQMIFRIVNYSTPWDGKINGKDAPVGTYYYIIDPRNGRKPITGFVDIIR